MDDAKLAPLRIEQQFDSDGTFEMRILSKDGGVAEYWKGTYKLDGDKLTSVRTERRRLQGEIDRRTIPQDAEKVVFKSPDRMELSEAGMSIAYKRK